MKAGVMARTFRDGREGMRVDADHPPPAHDPMNAGHLPVQVAARIVETAAGPAGELVEIDMLDPSAAGRALKPWPLLPVPHHQHSVPVDQNVGGPSGELPTSLQSEYAPKFQNSRNAATSSVPVQIAMRQRRSLVPLAALLPLSAGVGVQGTVSGLSFMFQNLQGPWDASHRPPAPQGNAGGL